MGSYNTRILPISVTIARRWGKLVADIGHNELDLAIAATALEHDLMVVTRNVSDFTPTGATVFDPFSRTTHAPA
jgi:toxin FitB